MPTTACGAKPYNKGRLLKTATRQTVTALALLAVALCSVVYLVTDVLFDRAVTVLLTAGTLLTVAVTWFALPLLRRRGDGLNHQTAAIRCVSRPSVPRTARVRTRDEIT